MTKDETGVKHNFLRVLYPIESREPSNGCIKYMCLCDCGNYHVVNGNNLRFERVKSCGCTRKKVRL